MADMSAGVIFKGNNS